MRGVFESAMLVALATAGDDSYRDDPDRRGAVLVGS